MAYDSDDNQDTLSFMENQHSYLTATVIAYFRTRYLCKAGPAAIRQRQADIYANLWSTDPSGNVRGLIDPRRRKFFLSKAVELVAEQYARGEITKITLTERDIISSYSQKYKFPTTIETTRIPQAPFLVRFSKWKYNEDALNSGRIRISPASHYADSSLNSAQYDEELRHFSVTPHERLEFVLYGVDTPGGAEHVLPHEPLELFRYMEVPNFYVLCCSSQYGLRMFHDFEADSALVIRDIDEFSKRLDAAVSQFVQSGFCQGQVSYYDPYIINRKHLIPGFSKHFRYAYQDEYRFIWTPKPTEQLTPFFVDIGPMHEIAELIRLA
jgi:hypothetical protein